MTCNADLICIIDSVHVKTETSSNNRHWGNVITSPVHGTVAVFLATHTA